jgi:hypothetical protein
VVSPWPASEFRELARIRKGEISRSGNPDTVREVLSRPEKQYALWDPTAFCHRPGMGPDLPGG